MEREVPWLRSDMLSEDELRHARAHELGVPFVTLEAGDISPAALELLPEPLCRANRLAAYATDGETLEVALLDLSDLAALEPLRAALRLKIAPRLTDRASLNRALLAYQKLLKERYGGQLMAHHNPDKALDALLRHAAAQRAREAHITVSGQGALVRYRMGGALHDAVRLPAAGISAAVRSRAKLHSKTLPQEGRFRADLGSGLELSVRVSTTPTVDGEKLVLSFVRREAGSRGYTLEGLGLHGTGAEALRAALERRAGLVLVCGREGGGRTTALYTMLDTVNAPELSLASVEERVASRLPYVAQTQADPSAGFSTAAALRAVLRQEPDVVMVDPVADRDTALLALSAAARGVLMLASIDAPDAAAGVERLRALGASDADLAGITCVVSVALVRRLCDKQSRATYKPSRAQTEPLEPRANFARVLAALKQEESVGKDIAWKDISYHKASGCSECEGGYRGQLGLYEVIPAQGVEPGLSILEDALFRAAQGLTSLEEVLRLAGE